MLARYGDSGTIRSLVGMGFDASATDGDRWTVLDVARRCGHDSIQVDLADIISTTALKKCPLAPISLEIPPGEHIQPAQCSEHLEHHEGVMGICQPVGNIMRSALTCSCVPDFVVMAVGLHQEYAFEPTHAPRQIMTGSTLRLRSWENLGPRMTCPPSKQHYLTTL